MFVHSSQNWNTWNMNPNPSIDSSGRWGAWSRQNSVWRQGKCNYQVYLESICEIIREDVGSSNQLIFFWCVHCWSRSLGEPFGTKSMYVTLNAGWNVSCPFKGKIKNALLCKCPGVHEVCSWKQWGYTFLFSFFFFHFLEGCLFGSIVLS